MAGEGRLQLQQPQDMAGPRWSAGQSAESLVFQLHGDLLRLLCDSRQQHFQGLGQAARLVFAGVGWFLNGFARFWSVLTRFGWFLIGFGWFE